MELREEQNRGRIRGVEQNSKGGVRGRMSWNSKEILQELVRDPKIEGISLPSVLTFLELNFIKIRYDSIV